MQPVKTTKMKRGSWSGKIADHYVMHFEKNKTGVRITYRHWLNDDEIEIRLIKGDGRTFREYGISILPSSLQDREVHVKQTIENFSILAEQFVSKRSTISEEEKALKFFNTWLGHLANGKIPSVHPTTKLRIQDFLSRLKRKATMSEIGDLVEKETNLQVKDELELVLDAFYGSLSKRKKVA